ncbi:CPBP family intramembrane glutamic endopeptidase [Staphylococcus auricularis]|uniref:CPBP family intramembrane metalloprotease n=1 Tax=Staphylococcus auricularis TaxID=29379 RepID=A0ABX5IGS8_9STAP|nr:CPBP family intramembrane glutamic endopeptidase [Staphylococcus auricularis]MCE5038532.1 CPBP family intramembrane metalloprotease [Staphylococcus auricularis]MEB6570226.1 CPBP family intramembrane metalloprotease [Staphylococcus auricularis]PTH19549.1 CPBP family intramembrane metalloprotease [Staphylococcus auricularis]PTH24819.1 CPBP family intramembrane metalloprotease [Staphylococcus auricularis]
MPNNETLNHESDNQQLSAWQQQSMMKRDFWLWPIYLIIPVVVIFILFIANLIVYPGGLFSENTITVIGGLTANLLILFSFYLMHTQHHLMQVTKQRFKEVKPYILMIILTFVVVLALENIYEWLVQFLPESLSYEETENQQLILDMFQNNWLLPILFLDIVIVTPMMEELLFRHIIIHELGKRITYVIAGILSVVIFAGAHCIGASSPFEIGTYLIMALGIVFVYFKSGKNIAVSFTFHALNNCISFISILLF